MNTVERPRVVLMNDSFPPTIDGVANVVVNYANVLQNRYADTAVATPWYPNVEDHYDFPVYRYSSLPIPAAFGYRCGQPFSAELMRQLAQFRPSLIHSHCPMISNFLARLLREQTGVPVIFTYHTKFDIDIRKALKSKLLQEATIKIMINNISACDEVWVVSRGAGENLRSLGYEGEYLVMENGVDFPKGKAAPEAIRELDEKWKLPAQIPIFLFVGRMMWYKGVRLSLDGLRKVKDAGFDFRFILIGDGVDRAEIQDYTKEIGLEDRCIFTGAIRDRELLRAYFSRADLFLFPSTFDTNGIVVREAAACSCPSLLIADSCAAEGIAHMRNGILVREDADSLAERVLWACGNRGALKEIGKLASEEIYLSWEDAIRHANRRYLEFLSEHKQPLPPRKPETGDDFFAAASETLAAVNKIRTESEMLIQRMKRP